MKRRDFLIGLGMTSFVPTTLRARELRPYTGPEITRVVLYKGRRRLYLMHGTEIAKQYKVGLGFAPKGAKQFEGDGKTPEGSYFIDRRNPQSNYHLSLGISYPNAKDVAYARSRGQRPGGEIFIHGRAKKNRGKGRDWTAGCIAVKDRQMEEIYMMVQLGTQIDIYP